MTAAETQPPASSDGSSGTEKDAITEVVRSFYTAEINGDGQAACSYLSAAGQRALVIEGQSLAREGADCAEVVEEAAPLLAGAKIPEIGFIQVSGDTATAIAPFEKPYTPQRVELRRIGGDWMIENDEDA